MQTKVLSSVLLVAMILAPEQLQAATIGNIDLEFDESMPSFKELPSLKMNGDLHIKVVFSNSEEDILILTQVPGTSIYEGHLQDDYEVPVVLIDIPLTKKRLIALNSVNFPHCRYFDVDLTTNNVECIHPPHQDLNETDFTLDRTSSEDCPEEGPIINLQNQYPEGFLLKTGFIFTRKFYEEFDGQDGKSSEEHIQEVIKIVQNAFKDKTIKNEVGTVIKIVPGIKIYDGDLDWYMGTSSKPRLHELTEDIGGNFDLHVYVKHSYGNPWGQGTIGTVCNKTGYNFNFIQAYGPKQCNFLEPKFDCTPTKSLLLTAEFISHEIGHNLGMWHDFQCASHDNPRKYQGESCKGLMDYILGDGNTWSKCSMMDFSRYVAPNFPCLKGT